MMTDIEIARSIDLRNINDIAKQIKIDTEQIYNYGKHIAKIPVSLIDDQKIKNRYLQM